MRSLHLYLLLAALAAAFVILAWARPINHDESQYVAAAVLSGHGMLPYRDYAYLQTPLQPLLFGPIVLLLGEWTYPGLRVLNALLGAAAVAGVYAAARVAGARAAIAVAVAALLATCDVLLFSAGTARNDALPAALFAWALAGMLKAERDGAGPAGAALTGLLLAAATAAKISYAPPALAYGVYALLHRQHRPLFLAAGASPIAALVAWTALASPAGFVFGTIDFPAHAPGEYYEGAGRAWKLGFGVKLIDALQFLAAGAALPALVLAAARRGSGRPAMLEWVILACIVSAFLPSPTLRQYLLPVLPPLFVRLAQVWQERPPGRVAQLALAAFGCAGLVPSATALAQGGGMRVAVAEGRALKAAMDRGRVAGPVATLAPQFLPATGRLPDARFAAGPFYFRTHRIADPRREPGLRVISGDRIPERFAPGAILVGGEGRWTRGDDGTEAPLERWAVRHRWRRIDSASPRFRLYVPVATSARRPSTRPA
jgi:hypothetical protein